ncbi:GAF domain-containing sensor histidine kinase [Mastigocoleus testarum]|uniref:histidine kinase n=1 Tax=Mastigocoleus testarum BC008 TaxID=371196 RepID=A0A0V7ZFF5_9CYAN|nr:GAF domain-containing protein [Mastigocoleus testarum]KST63084.1 ATPase [Mastigocoleus testarum BC008]KST69058.1 ATPase [Mastigocoleus testarum BC008]
MQLISQKLKKELDFFSNDFKDEPEQQKILARIIEEIRQATDLNKTFETIVAQVRQLLNADRVGIFQFVPENDWEGTFVFEDVGTGWDSILGEKIQDRCIGGKLAADYSQARVQAITDIYAPQVNDCYAQMLCKFQVKANLVIPLIRDKQLWGLVCVHQCSNTREWKGCEIKLVLTIAKLLRVTIEKLDRIEKADLAQKLDRVKQRHKIILEAIEKIRQSLDIKTILSTTTLQARQLLEVDRVAIFKFNPDWSGNFVAESFEQPWTPLIGVVPVIHDTFLQETQGGRYANQETFVVDDIYQAGLSDCHIGLLEQFQAKAFVIAPILQSNKLWGLIAAYQNSSSRHWQTDEIELLAQITSQVAVALSHNELLGNTQYQVEQQKALIRTLARMRKSVNLENIFQTTVVEVRQLLKVDRVAIFRFDPGNQWEGEVIYEDVALGFKSTLKDKVYDHCFAQNYVPIYRQNRVSTISDIYQQDFKECYVQMLERFQVRANCIAPLIKEGELWGLLCIHQCDKPREWESSDIDFVYQIAEKLGVALTQDAHSEKVHNDMKVKAAEAEQAVEQQKLLAVTIDKIRRSLDIQTILETSTQEVRELLNVDRVSIYRFDSDWKGEFVADSFKDGLQPQVKTQAVMMPAFVNANQNGNLPRNEIFAPISQGEKLWGLLIAHQHSYPRHWKEHEIDLLNQVGVQLGVGIEQGELLQHSKDRTAEISKTFEEIKQTQEYLIQGEKMDNLAHLLGGILSEITNPINFIVENLTDVSKCTQNLFEITNLYQHTYPEASPAIERRIQELDADLQNKDLYETLKSMRIGAKQVGQTLGLLEKFSRPDRAEQKLADITEELDNTLLLLEHRLKANDKYPGIEVVKKYDTLPLVECYPDLLNQVFIKILLHHIDALKKKFVNISQQYLKPSTQSPYIPLFIWITTQIIDNKISIKFTDNSEGMTELNRSQVFEPISKTKEIPQKTGLNLAICHQIVVEKHQGELKCFSQLGQGTEFLIQIPTTPTTAIEYSQTSKVF